METDGITDSDPALLHQSEWGNSPACNQKFWEKVCKQRNGIAFDGQGGKAIGDDDGEVAGRRLELGNGIGVECPAKNRLTEIGSAVRGVGLKLEDSNGGFSDDGEFGVEALGECGKEERSVYGVARLSVGELEI
jgi:hypothetical protein